MSVFGNGVIEGWEVAVEETFTISVSEGFGNINFTAARTEFPFSITDISPNSINYVFARTKGRTTFAEDVDFLLSPTQNITDPNFLLLAQVVAGANSIENIDNSIRQEIGFLELIKAAIRQHKHRGGALNPSKVDLSSEVKGQLPAFRIADFDAEKITTGTFELSRLPLLDHQDLANVGLLTHPQLDTFVKTLESTNKEIFGEIGTANLLQLILAMKFIYDDPDSALFLDDKTVDENMINEFAVIPGITSNSFIDFDNSTAEIDLEQHFIRGVPPTTGTSFYVNFDTALAWESSFKKENLVVVGDTITLAFNEDEESNIITIEGFETATAPDQLLSGTADGGQELLRKETVITTDNAKITANAVATNVIEGFYSGKFSHQQEFRSQFVKEFDTVQDWGNFDSFVLHVKCLDALHGPVKLFFTDADGNKSTEFVVLDQDEITTNDEPQENAFEMRVIDLAQVSFRGKVKSFTIFSDDTENPFTFFIDFINIQRAILLPEQGKLTLRYSTAKQVTFSVIDWISIEPAGTEIRVRARSASGTVFLTRSEFTPFLANGDVINLEGTDLEIEVEFTPDGDRLSAPVLESLRILILTDAELDGFKIDTFPEFIRAIKTENLTITGGDASATVTLTSPIFVDSYYFALGNSVQQIHEETTGDGNKFAQGERAIFANSAPVAPNQIFKAIEDAQTRVTLPALFEPRSVIRRDGRTFVIADTFNDRIMEITEEGELITGIGSVNYEHGSKIFPFAATIDIRTGILYLVWSKKISFKTVDVGKIVLQTTTQKVQLIKDFDKILGLSSAELETVGAEGQIMPIHLSLQNAGLVRNLPVDDTRLLASTDVLDTGIDTDSVFYDAIVNGLGIPCFIGNFAYIDGIFSPTFADKTDDDGFIIANATIGVKEYAFPTGVEETISLTTSVSDIIEVDKNNNVIFGSDKMKFSPFVPGKVDKIDNFTLLIGGIRPGGQVGDVTPEELNFRAIAGDDAERVRRKQVINQLLFDGGTPLVGAVIVLDTRANATTFEYVSPEGIVVSDVDSDSEGQYVVAESSFSKSGRVIKLDAVGNIIFSFGEGLYSIINDVKVQFDDSMVIST